MGKKLIKLLEDGDISHKDAIDQIALLGNPMRIHKAYMDIARRCENPKDVLLYLEAAGGLIEKVIGTSDIDYLTELPQRATFKKDFIKSREALRRNNIPFGFMFMDLDYFKEVNDNHGHSSGDMILRKIASKLQHITRVNDSIYRIGGDEFGGIFPNLYPKDVSVIGENIVKRIKEFKIELNNDEIYTPSISVGAYFPKVDESFEDAFDKADNAMYLVKKNGKNGFALLN